MHSSTYLPGAREPLVHELVHWCRAFGAWARASLWWYAELWSSGPCTHARATHTRMHATRLFVCEPNRARVLYVCVVSQVTYRELARKLVRSSRGVADSSTTALLTALAWSSPEESMGAGKARGVTALLDNSKWGEECSDVASVREVLRARLVASGAHVSDLLEAFDQDAHSAVHERAIDDIEFYHAMRSKVGYRGPHHVLQAVFAELDTDHDGAIGFDELFEFVRGRRHSLDRRTKRIHAMRLQAPSGEGSALGRLAWDESTLRVLLQQALERCHVGPTDLIRAWDTSGDGQLNESEFVSRMQKLFDGHGDDLWRNEVHAYAQHAYLPCPRACVRAAPLSPPAECCVTDGFCADVVARTRWPLNAGATSRSRGIPQHPVHRGRQWRRAPTPHVQPFVSCWGVPERPRLVPPLLLDVLSMCSLCQSSLFANCELSIYFPTVLRVMTLICACACVLCVSTFGGVSVYYRP